MNKSHISYIIAQCKVNFNDNTGVNLFNFSACIFSTIAIPSKYSKKKGYIGGMMEI